MFTKKSVLFVVAIFAIVLSACAAPAGPVQNTNVEVVVVQAPAECTTCGQPADAPAPATAVAQPTPIPTEEVAPTQTGFGANGMGVENDFPGGATKMVNGPAIAELWDPGANVCALVKILENEKLSWNKLGAWWYAMDSDSLDRRWPDHKAEYNRKGSGCPVYNSVAAFLAANPTYK